MSQSVWKERHDSYKKQGLDEKPTIFAEQVLSHLPAQANILELGAGLGQDSRYFAGLGYAVTMTDYVDAVLQTSRQRPGGENTIHIQTVDISKPLPFADASYDVVYAHLSLHYFDTPTTRAIFAEINRVLKPHGNLAFLVNSTSDPEFQSGTKIEEEFYEIGNKVKRYFSLQSTADFTKNFETILLDNAGETYKDRAIGVHNLIRYIGTKR